MSKASRVLRAAQAGLSANGSAATTQQQTRLASTAIARFAGSRSHNNGILVGLASSLVVPGATVALCEGNDENISLFKKDKDGNTDIAGSITQVTESDFWDKVATVAGHKVQNAYDTGVPSQLSYGFVSGYCTGYALKVVGRGAAVVFGLGFMSLQTLNYYGYVKVDHGKIQSDFNNAMDLNKDGKVDKDDAQIAHDKLMKVLQYELPTGGGFGAGFIAGVRSG